MWDTLYVRRIAHNVIGVLDFEGKSLMLSIHKVFRVESQSRARGIEIINGTKSAKVKPEAAISREESYSSARGRISVPPMFKKRKNEISTPGEDFTANWRLCFATFIFRNSLAWLYDIPSLSFSPSPFPLPLQRYCRCKSGITLYIVS